MTVLKVLTEPDVRLRKKSLPVDHVDKEILTLLDDLYETMEAYGGCGIAAPQVNVHKRVFLMQIEKDAPITECINPEIFWRSATKELGPEGCLSVPQYYEKVMRAQEIEVRFLDRTGAVQERRFSGLEAVCMQHEIDHLDGILFIDHLSSVKRMMAMQRLAKQLAHPN